MFQVPLSDSLIPKVLPLKLINSLPIILTVHVLAVALDNVIVAVLSTTPYS